MRQGTQDATGRYRPVRLAVTQQSWSASFSTFRRMASCCCCAAATWPLQPRETLLNGRRIGFGLLPARRDLGNGLCSNLLGCRNLVRRPAPRCLDRRVGLCLCVGLASACRSRDARLGRLLDGVGIRLCAGHTLFCLGDLPLRGRGEALPGSQARRAARRIPEGAAGPDEVLEAQRARASMRRSLWTWEFLFRCFRCCRGRGEAGDAGKHRATPNSGPASATRTWWVQRDPNSRSGYAERH